MHDVRGIQGADQQHGSGEDDAAADGGRATTPFVCEEGCGNAEGEHEDGGDAGGEERRCLRWYSCLREDGRGVLRDLVSIRR